MKKHKIAQATPEVVAVEKDCSRICQFNSNQRHLVAQHLKRFMAFLTFLVISFASCSAAEPAGKDKLPWNVFPLNDVKWVYEKSLNGPYSISDSITHEYLATIWMNGKSEITYSVKQIGENTAELHFHSITTASRVKAREGMEPEQLPDSTWTEEYLAGIITIEGRKVYVECYEALNYTGLNKALLYDFSLNVGDKFRVGSSGKYGHDDEVYSIDSVRVGNEYRKRYNFVYPDSWMNPPPNYDFSIVEGIGSAGEGFFKPLYGEPHGSEWFEPYLRNVYYKDVKIYPMGGK